MLCPVHNQEYRVVPAGVSKTSGKPYPAFYACPDRGCKLRPSERPPIQTPVEKFNDELNLAAAQMVNTKKDSTITRLALAKSALENGMRWSLETQQELEKWLRWCENKAPLASVTPEEIHYE